MFNKLLLPILMVAFACPGLFAQDNAYRSDSIYSSVLKEYRKLRISFPKNYKPDSATYDVLYVLDGEWNTSLAQTLYGFLEYGGFIPSNLIVVGLPNNYQKDINLRDRDFTPTAAKWSSETGGAANFLAFLKTELVPYIDKTYRTNKKNSTLYGTSLGGLFTVYAFLQEPELFRSWLAIEPSLWWDNGYLIGIAAGKLPSMKGINSSLFIANRDGWDYRQMGVLAMDSVLQRYAPAGLQWKCVGYPNETHFTAIWKGIYDGWKFCYSGKLPEGKILVNPSAGIIVKDKPFTFWCFNSSAEYVIRYTTDGTEPVQGSKTLKYEQTLQFNQPTTVKVKSISVREEYASKAECTFRTGEPLPPVQKPKGVKQGILHYTCYRGSFNAMPDVKKLKPFQTGSAGKDFDPAVLANQDDLAWLVDGFVEISEEGYYIFEMNADLLTKVWIAGEQVIGNHPVPGVKQTFIMPLKKGFYPVRMEYIQKKGTLPQPLLWINTSKQEMPVPMEAFYSKE